MRTECNQCGKKAVGIKDKTTKKKRKKGKRGLDKVNLYKYEQRTKGDGR